MLDLLSRRAMRVVSFVWVADARGGTPDHRKILPYFKLWIAGEATDSKPPLGGTAYFVRASSIAASVINMGFRLGFGAKYQETTAILSNADAFSSPQFAALFERSSLPADIGGTLTVGIDGHCCRGVPLPSLNDSDAVWKHYEERLSPSLLAQVARRVQSSSALTAALAKRSSGTSQQLDDEFEAARARHRDSPKRFACFLSHHKQACAAEARLVKQQLESLLDAKVFLGK